MPVFQNMEYDKSGLNGTAIGINPKVGAQVYSSLVYIRLHYHYIRFS